MIDIHSHILWDVDDGASLFEQTVSMLNQARDAGTTDIVATPHADHRYTIDPALVDHKIARLSAIPGLGIRVHRGCEFHVTYDNVLAALDHPLTYTVAGGPYLLAELPDFRVPPSIDTAIDRLLKADLIPVITHPERNEVVRADYKRLSRWVEAGCLVQVTASSLTGLFGRAAKKAAHDLLRRQLVHVVASDAHDDRVRHPRLDAARRAIADEYGQDLAAEFFERAPAAILAGERFDPPLPALIDEKPRTWSLW